jgi:preprotein translocase subunit SecG
MTELSHGRRAADEFTQHEQMAPHDHGSSQHGHEGHDTGSVNAMAVSATLHCLTGCAIGEIAGLMIGTAAGLSNAATIPLAVGLAFLFGYTLSTLPLLRVGMTVGAALSIVLAADTLSILTMEIVDNAVMGVIPGAMDAGLVNVIFWVGMLIALAAAFLAAYPVNRYLLQRGKGHALTHEYHHNAGPVTGARRFIPALSTSALVAAILAFMLGGLVVALADELGTQGGGQHEAAPKRA